jgi:hypothetical protein
MEIQMTKIILKSVGSVFNKEDMCVHPMLAQGAHCVGSGVHLEDVDCEWFSSLSRDDADKLKEFLIDECGKCFKALHLDESECPFTSQSKYYEGSVSQKHDNLKSILSKLNDAISVKCDDCGHKGTEFDEFGSRMFVNVETYSSNFVPNGGFFRCLACDEECDGERDFIKE